MFDRIVAITHAGGAVASVAATIILSIYLTKFEEKQNDRMIKLQTSLAASQQETRRQEQEAQRLSRKVDRTVALYSKFTEDQDIQNLLKISHLTEILTTPPANPTKIYKKNIKIDKAAANLELFYEFFPVEGFSALDLQIEALNRCVFGEFVELSNKSPKSNKRILNHAPILDLIKNDWESPDALCDAKTVFVLYGPHISRLFWENRGAIYCSGIYKNRPDSLIQFEAFIKTYSLWLDYLVKDPNLVPPDPSIDQLIKTTPEEFSVDFKKTLSLRNYCNLSERRLNEIKTDFGRNSPDGDMSWNYWYDEARDLATSTLTRRRRRFDKPIFNQNQNIVFEIDEESENSFFSTIRSAVEALLARPGVDGATSGNSSPRSSGSEKTDKDERISPDG